MSRIKFSIIIPTYKRELLLKEAIYSALSQNTDSTYEIVVVDDNQNNSSYALTNKIVEYFNDNRIRVYKNENNLGCFGNMNRCIELANYEYIVMLHDDDLLKVNYLTSVTEILSENKNIDMLFCDKEVIINGKTIDKTGFYKLNKTINKFINIEGKIVKVRQSDFLVHNIVGGPTGTVFKKSKAISIGSFNDSLFPIADYYFWSEYSFNFNAYMLIKELAVCRQDNNITLSKNMYPRIFKSCYELQNMLLKDKLKTGFLSKVYPYESIRIRIKSLRENADIKLDLDTCYTKATGYKYQYSAINSIMARAFLIKKSLAWCFRILKAKIITSELI